MAENLSDFLKSIQWDNVEKVHVTQDGKYYSFAVEIDKKKRIVTVGVGPDTTTLTVSDMKGNVMAHAIQKGKEITYFSPQKK